MADEDESEGNGNAGDIGGGTKDESGTGRITRRNLLLAGGGVAAAGAGAGILSAKFVVSPDVPAEKLESEYTNEESEFARVAGARVHYRDQGPRDAPAVVLVHGFASSLHTWEGWVNRLGDRYRLVSLDLPAFGLTGPNESGEYGVGYYADVVDALADELGLDTFSLAGNSMGGEVSWRYALDNPDRVDKLLLVDSAGLPGGGDEFLIITLARYPVLDRIPRHITPRSSVRSLVKSAYADDSLVTDDLVERYYDLLRREGNREAIVKRLRDPAESRADEIPEIDVPTLVMWGNEDTWITPEHADRFVEDIPGAELVTYDGVGHVPMEEAPETSASDAADYLGR